MKGLLFAEDETDEWLVNNWQPGTLRGIARDLRRLMKGDKPLKYRPLPEFGSQVGELKRGALRVVYTTEFPRDVGIACAFRKDAKKGNHMRSEHKRQIERGLAKLRAGEGVEPEHLSDYLRSVH